MSESKLSPQTLRYVLIVANLLKSKKIRRVGFLNGAGVSVAAGIPDFRSPGGMYDTLRPELLTATEEERAWMRADPTMVVNTRMFSRNQFPYLEVRRPFILGLEDTWKPTIFHWFQRLCDNHKLLKSIYTQNIDGLDYKVGINPEKIVSVHGSMGTVQCEGCDAMYDADEFTKQVRLNIKDIYNMDKSAPSKSSNILCLECKKALVKPATVLYGCNLPDDFFDMLEAEQKAVQAVKNGQSVAENEEPLDILFVCGTSLTVGPANSVVYKVSNKCLRVIVNREPCGEDLGIVYGEHAKRDIFLQGECDVVFKAIIDALHWTDELAQLQATKK